MPITSTMNPPVSTATILKLAEFLRDQGSDRDPVDVIETAIDYWMENAAWKKDDLMAETVIRDEERGYTWKSIFLPSGTLVRIKYNGSFTYAKVDGDYLIYKGERVSPNQFALKVTGTPRDAWRDLWIKKPADADYRLADDLRRVSEGKQVPELTLKDLGL
jgi:hypothetical protein